MSEKERRHGIAMVVEMSNEALAAQIERNLCGDGFTTPHDTAMLFEAAYRLRWRYEAPQSNPDEHAD